MKRLFAVLVLVVLGVSRLEAAPTVYVILWFDTEDYILPASDDAALKVANWLTAEGVKATFKIVGEKARTLEKRGRTDVIDALKKHEIGYHSNFHSVQPTPAQYLSALGWDDGVAEFDRRERPGYDDVKRIFGQSPSCYGQPGSSWGPQSFGAMRNWMMPVYLDAGRHVSFQGKPHYYGGLLTLYHLTHTLRTDLGGDSDLQKAQDRFQEARKKILTDGGGIVSVYYHPCEFVHKQFWDGANFTKGANPPREKWQLPTAKSEQESKIAYQTFFDYVLFLKRFNDVQFITATEAAELYRDTSREKEFSTEELKAIAKSVENGITFQQHGNTTLSASEILYLISAYVAEKTAGKDPKSVKRIPTPYGPSHAPTVGDDIVSTDPSQFLRTTNDVLDYLRTSGRVPSTVWLGSTGITPESYLAALAPVALALLEGKPVPDTLAIPKANLAAAKYVADDDPKLWGWVIFPPGFRAPNLMALAKRQAWTFKPAILHGFQR